MSDARAFFDRIAPRYDREFAPDARATAADLRPVTARRPDDGEWALDVGCGTGRAWPTLHDAGWSIVGLDASLAMLSIAGRRTSAAKVSRVRADLYAPWPLATGAFSLVIALHGVLLHPRGDAADARHAWAHVGREIARVARPGARVIIDLPDPAWARAHLRELSLSAPELDEADDSRFLYVGPRGEEVVAVVPPPAHVVEALGLSLTIVTGLHGPRAIGELP
jgi:SAM-dependent methyltransferase